MIRVTTILVIHIAMVCFGQVELKPIPKQQIFFTRIDYDVNKDILDMQVVLKNGTNDEVPTVDLNANLYEDVKEDLHVSVTIAKRGSQTDYHSLIKTGQLNVCEFFKKPDREPLVKMLLAALNQYGHMMFDCPVEKGKYYLNDFKLDSSNLPMYIPAGDYRVDLAVTKKHKDTFLSFFRMFWYATVADNNNNNN